MKNYRSFDKMMNSSSIVPKSNSSNLLNSSFLFGFFFPGVLGPSFCLTILLSVDKEEPVASAICLNKDCWLSVL